ncbi:MAG: hypothetical protein QG620_282 [Patescibacteria group bacterium]|nr:hypothetical protein [Patescibacteria group bacterium]
MEKELMSFFGVTPSLTLRALAERKMDEIFENSQKRKIEEDEEKEDKSNVVK